MKDSMIGASRAVPLAPNASTSTVAIGSASTGVAFGVVGVETLPAAQNSVTATNAVIAFLIGASSLNPKLLPHRARNKQQRLLHPHNSQSPSDARLFRAGASRS